LTCDLTADFIFHINIGPPVIWLFALMIFAAILYVACHGVLIRERIGNAYEVGKRVYQQTNPPWQAPGPPLLPQRVDPRSGIIMRRYGAEEEGDDDTA
jgi:hypothetical protein